jgi:hypothetical protein
LIKHYQKEKKTILAQELLEEALALFPENSQLKRLAETP